MNFPKPQDLLRSFVNGVVHRAVWMIPKPIFIVVLIVVVALSFLLNR